MTVNPTIQPFEYEADTGAVSTTLFYTVGETGAISETMDAAPPRTMTSETLTYSGSNPGASFGWVSPPNVPNTTSWPAQTYTVTLDVASPNANLTITEVKLYRVDANADGGTNHQGLAVVGDLTGLSQSLGTAGTLIFQVSGSAQTASATDRIAAKIYITNTAASSESFSYYAGQNSGSGIDLVQPLALEADTSAASSGLFYTNGESGAVSQIMDSASSASPAGETLTYAGNDTGASWGWISSPGIPNSASWPAGNYTVTLNVTQANANLKVSEVKVYRVDANADGGTDHQGLATVGDLAGLSQSLGSAGTLTFIVPGAAQSANSTDRLAVKFYVANSASTSQSFTYSAGAGSGSGINLSGGHAIGTTGIQPWWTYHTGQLPGVGAYMINVANGNLLIKASDVDVPERGVDLAFTRTYNSQSTHDSNNTDGSVPDNYGDGWTNSFDAHLAYDGSNTISVYDSDGTRFDYTANGLGGWTAPTGEYATLTWDGSCGYQWSKTDGTVYYFYSPDLNQTSTCSEPYPQDAAYGGRVYQIWGRNHNNSITFTYSWTNGDASSAANLAGITATHSDGDKIVLSFGTTVSGGLPVLATLTRPDGQIVSYNYNGTSLTDVIKPGSTQVSTSHSTYQYTNVGEREIISEVASPLFNANGSANAGDNTYFSYDGFYRATQTQDYGVVNYAPSDGVVPETVLQPAYPSGMQTWTTTKLSYPGGVTELSDTFGHYINWYSDAFARVTEVQRWDTNPSGQGLWISWGQTWDGQNNLMSSTDPRGMVGATPDATYETDYAYDSVGDLVAVAQPAIALNNGTYRPTYVFSYDSNHNVLATCDPVVSHSNGLDWSGPGQGGNPGTSGSRCPSSSGTAHYTWDYTDSNEPLGRISSIYSANGYHYAVSYAASSEGNVDAGLPTTIVGDPISQPVDGTTPSRTPALTVTYRSNGEVLSINAGNGASSYSYDDMHRQVSMEDADAVSSYTCYNNDGTVFYTETPSQHAADGSPAPCSTPLPSGVSAPGNADSYTYDADGNQVSAVHHYGSITGTTNMFYDAADRLVEVQLPHDATVFPGTSTQHDLYPKAWLTRYLYDNTGSMLWSDPNGNGNYGVGHLYKVQEYLPSNPVVAANTVPSSQEWMDVRGWAWDGGLDQPQRLYEFALGQSPRMTYLYNGSNATLGLLYQAIYGSASSSNPAIAPTYYANGWLNGTSYLNDGGATAAKTYQYDADGRPTTLTSSTLGSETRRYDDDGNLTTVAEPSSYGGAGTMTYQYYPDDTLSSLAVTAPNAFSSTPSVSYGYRPDFSVDVEQPSWIAGVSFKFTYTAAGRPLTEQDPSTGQSVTMYNTSGVQQGSRTLQQRVSTYDSFGRLKMLVLPEGYTYSAFSYDDEDEPTQYETSNGWCDNSGVFGTCPASSNAFIYDVRGELLQSSVNGATVTRQSADGFMCTPSSGGCQEGFDARNNMLLTAKGFTYSYNGYGWETGVQNGGLVTRSYDADGHLAIQQNASTATLPCDSFQYGCDPGTNAVDVGTQGKYTWGPTGRMVNYVNDLLGARYTSGPPSYWEHWDELTGELIFENLTTGGAIQGGGPQSNFNVGHLGVSNASNGITVEDRDPFGQIAATHDSYGFAAWTALQPSQPLKLGQPYSSAQGSNYPSTDPQSATRILDASRPDAYVDQTYGVSFQGVRAADANTTQWLTPDPFAGAAAAPLSQQPYTWNNNNPLLMADPTGYCGSTSTGSWMSNGYYCGSSAGECPAGYSAGSATPVPFSDGDYGNSCSPNEDWMDTSGDFGMPIVHGGTANACLSGASSSTCTRQPHCRFDPGAGWDCQDSNGKWKTVNVMTSGPCVLKGAGLGLAAGLGLDLLSAAKTATKVAVASGMAANEGEDVGLAARAAADLDPPGLIVNGFYAGAFGVGGGIYSAAHGCSPAW